MLPSGPPQPINTSHDKPCASLVPSNHTPFSNRHRPTRAHADPDCSHSHGWQLL